MAAPVWVDHLLAQWRTVVKSAVDGIAALAPKPGVDPAAGLVRPQMLPDTTAVYRWLPVFRGSMRLMLLVQSFSTAGDDILDLEMRLLFRKRLMQPAPCKGLAEARAGDASEGQREAKRDGLFGALWDYMGGHTPCPRTKSTRNRDNEEEWLETLDSIRVAFEGYHFNHKEAGETIEQSRGVNAVFYTLLEGFLEIHQQFWSARAMEGTTRECADAWVKRARRIVCLGVPWSRLQALQAGLAGGVEHMQALCRSLHGRHDLASIGLVGEIVEEAMADDESPIEFCMFLARLHAGLQGVARDLEDLRALARQLTAEYADELRESRLLFRSALDGLAATKIPPHEGGMPVARQCI